MNCRHCQRTLERVFLDLGFAPPSNRYLGADDLQRPEQYLPLKLFVCDGCWLVQTQDTAGERELFTDDYAYFSSISQGWLAHAASYARMISTRLDLQGGSFVVEVASNDGYLLRNFVAAGIPCLGIEPTASTAAAAERQGVPVWREFFGRPLAARLVKERGRADLIVGNNVYAHVPDINAFTAALAMALKPEGVVTLEFPHLLRLIEGVQFDTVYHEHYSYLSLTSVARVFRDAGLRIFDVEELPTHGGSLRVYGCLMNSNRPEMPAVAELLRCEVSFGLTIANTYDAFQSKISGIRDDLLTWLIAERRGGRSVAAYGAAAKGNTLLNYAGVKPDLLPYVCDAAPSKQGRFLPGSHIPILSPDVIRARKPDSVLLLPWNISEEISRELRDIKAWGGKLVVAVPNMAQLP